MTGDEIDEGSAFEFEGFGLKVPLGAGGEDPESWGDVWKRVKHHFRRIAVNISGLVADVLAGFRNVVVGITQIPVQTARWVGAKAVTQARLRRIAEVEETDKQATALSKPLLDEPDSRSLVAEKLEKALERLHARGLHAEIREVDGIMVVCVVSKEFADALDALIEHGFKEVGPDEPGLPEPDPPGNLTLDE